MRFSAVPLCVTALLTTGCVPAWVSPTRDDAATVTFVEEATGFVHVHLFAKGETCQDEKKVTGFGGLKGKTEIKVAPGEEIAPSVTILDGNWSCTLLMSFVPKPREAYAVAITGGGPKCKMGIGHLEGQKVVPEPSARKRTKVGERCE
jgi:hypothetical protein